MKKNKVYSIILVGFPGSGKTTGAKYLKKLGWDIISAGDIIREMSIQEGLPTSRKYLQEFGARLLQEKGYEYFADIMLSKSSSSDKVVFEGIRPVQVVDLIKKALPKVLIIFIEAKSVLREKRLIKSKNIKHKDFIEMEENPLECEVMKIKPIADIVINNDTYLNYFYNELYLVVSYFINQ